MNKISRKTSNRIIVVSAFLILTIAIILVLTRKSGTLDEAQKNFAVKDTNAITRIFLVDGYGNQSLLERMNGTWLLNGEYDVVQQNVDDMLGCIYNLEVKDIVAESARNTINKQMAVGATKVEIYYTDYRIRLGNLKLFQHTQKKVYYIGQPTMDNMGNYAIMEGATVPCVVYLPGFRGFVSPKYSPLEDSWRSHVIVRLKMAKIKEIQSVDMIDNNHSFRILRSGNRTFDIVHMVSNQTVNPYDTMRLLDFLSDFRDLNYESAVGELTKGKRDSIFMRPFKELQIVDGDGNTTTITLFYLENEYNTEEYEYNIDFMEAYNRDKFYAILNQNKDEIYRCQYFVFDRIVQPLEFFLPDSKILAVPKPMAIE
jgi:hypothetical protein